MCILLIWPALQCSLLKCYTANWFLFYEKLQSINWQMFIKTYKSIICPCLLETSHALAAAVQSATSEICIPHAERTLLWPESLPLFHRQCKRKLLQYNFVSGCWFINIVGFPMYNVCHHWTISNICSVIIFKHTWM